MYFGKNLIKQKLQDASDLVGWVTFLGPNPDLEGPGPHVLLELWSLLLKGVHKIKFVVCFPKSYLVRLDTFYPGPRVQGGQKGGPKGFWSLSRTFWQTLYNTKIFGHPPPNIVGWVTFVDPKSRSGRTWAWCSSGAVVLDFQGDIIKLKL